MPRVKTGVTARARHKKILKITKGQKRSKHALYRRANEAMLKSLWYSNRDRHNRKRDMRRLWIVRINAAAREHGITYSRLINGLNKAGVEVNRKILADMALSDTVAFAKLAEVAKTTLAA